MMTPVVMAWPLRVRAQVAGGLHGLVQGRGLDPAHRGDVRRGRLPPLLRVQLELGPARLAGDPVLQPLDREHGLAGHRRVVQADLGRGGVRAEALQGRAALGDDRGEVLLLGELEPRPAVGGGDREQQRPLPGQRLLQVGQRGQTGDVTGQLGVCGALTDLLVDRQQRGDHAGVLAGDRALGEQPAVQRGPQRGQPVQLVAGRLDLGLGRGTDVAQRRVRRPVALQRGVQVGLLRVELDLLVRLRDRDQGLLLILRKRLVGLRDPRVFRVGPDDGRLVGRRAPGGDVAGGDVALGLQLVHHRGGLPAELGHRRAAAVVPGAADLAAHVDAGQHEERQRRHQQHRRQLRAHLPVPQRERRARSGGPGRGRSDGRATAGGLLERGILAVGRPLQGERPGAAVRSARRCGSALGQRTRGGRVLRG